MGFEVYDVGSLVRGSREGVFKWSRVAGLGRRLKFGFVFFSWYVFG